MIKPKAKKCKACKNSFMPRSSWQVACSPGCAQIIAVKINVDKEKKLDAVRREKLKSLNELIAEAQTSFNAYIRMRAVRFKHGCMSCGTKLMIGGVGGGFDCGHYRSRGSAGHLRFDMNAAWGQCKYCNRHLGGNYSAYRNRLIDHIGINKVDAIENDNRIVKFSREYLTRLKLIFAKKTLRMKKRISISGD